MLIVATSALIISFGSLAAIDNYKEIKKTQAEIIRLESDKQRLHEQLEKTNKDNQQQIDQQKQTEEQLRKEIEALKVAKAERERQRLALLSAQKATAAAPVQSAGAGWHYECRSQAAAVKQAVFELGLGDQWTYIDFILGHESCHDPGRLNAGGCAGLGQACPGTKLPCGPNDIKCQVQWFNTYAQGKGGWAASYSFWLANNWW